jgi:hypothetical protein
MGTPQVLRHCFNCHANYASNSSSLPSIVHSYTHTERKIMKVLLLTCLHHLFFELFQNEIRLEKNHSSMESYAMDNKIIQFLIRSIVDSGEYTLEGIAYQSRIPFDVIFNAACGNNTQLSMTAWVRIVDLYIQVNRDVAQVLFNKLIEIKDKNNLLSLLLNEQ